MGVSLCYVLLSLSRCLHSDAQIIFTHATYLQAEAELIGEGVVRTAHAWADGAGYGGGADAVDASLTKEDCDR